MKARRSFGCLDAGQSAGEDRPRRHAAAVLISVCRMSLCGGYSKPRVELGLGDLLGHACGGRDEHLVGHAPALVA